MRYESIYRVAPVPEPWPNDYRSIMRAVGAPVHVTYIPTETSEHADAPACPDCGKELIWAEAGYVPGWRKCIGCGADYITDMYGVVEPAYAVITCQGCGYGLPAGLDRGADCPVCLYDALR